MSAHVYDNSARKRTVCLIFFYPDLLIMFTYLHVAHFAYSSYRLMVLLGGVEGRSRHVAA